MKKIIIVVAIAIMVITIYIVYFLYPKNIHVNIQGIKYRLGTENIETEKSIHINIEGKLFRSITGNKTFKGFIDIEGEEINVPQDQRELVIRFYRGNNGVVVYTYIENGLPKIHQYGTMFVNHDFSKVTLLVTDKIYNEGNESGSWAAENGQMISAPANNRTAALSISNELMKEFLNGYKLK